MISKLFYKKKLISKINHICNDYFNNNNIEVKSKVLINNCDKYNLIVRHFIYLLRLNKLEENKYKNHIILLKLIVIYYQSQFILKEKLRLNNFDLDKIKITIENLNNKLNLQINNYNIKKEKWNIFSQIIECGDFNVFYCHIANIFYNINLENKAYYDYGYYLTMLFNIHIIKSLSNNECNLPLYKLKLTIIDECILAVSKIDSIQFNNFIRNYNKTFKKLVKNKKNKERSGFDLMKNKFPLNYDVKQQNLENENCQFDYRLYHIIIYIIAFPFFFPLAIYFGIKWYRFCQTYKKFGEIINVKGEIIKLNTLEEYNNDINLKRLNRFNYLLTDDVFSKLKIKEFDIYNRKNQPLNTLIIENSVSNKWVIALHGWQENKWLALRLAYHFYNNGYNVLAFDSVAHGKSYGKKTGIGYFNSENVHDVVQYLQKNFQIDSIGIIGNSMGASCAIFYYGKYGNIDKLVKWIIADCPFASFKIQTRYVNQYRYFWPWWVIYPGISLIWRLKTGFSIGKYKAYQNFKAIADKPIMFIHGDEDWFVPVFSSKKLYFQKLKYETKSKSKLLIFNKSNHCITISTHQQEYVEQTLNFAYENEKNNIKKINSDKI